VSAVTLCDVGPRDGLQNHTVTLEPDVRAELCRRLAATGLPRVEAASFVHPARVPQMAGAEEVLAGLDGDGAVSFSALVLNARGMERAQASGVRELHVAYPVTDEFGRRNQNMTADQARLWGGTADQPFDPNYHKPSDTLDHIDRTALDIQGGGVGYIVGLYAQDLGGRNGVPVRDDRTRHVLTPS